MIKNYLLGLSVFFSLLTVGVRGQDVAVIATTAPVSACNLSASENVVIKVFNYGPSDLSGMNIPVSYTINGGTAVNEVANFPSFLPNSTVTYTFTTVADLSIPGTYTIDASTGLAGDTNPTNDAFSGYTVTNTAPSVGGTAMGGTNVCISGNSGNVTLAGQTGNVLNWEYSTDGGSTWINISNTTTTQSYSNLTIPTRYRANVQNGSCTPASSSVAIFTIDPTTVGGTVAASATVCSGSNGATLNLSGKTGNVQYWEYSTDGGATWTNIANTTTSQAYSNLTTTTRYRANVKSGACSAANSSSAIITVNPVTVGGSISPASSTVCSGSNGGTLTLSGHTGSVVRWEFSTNGGFTWNNITNTTVNQNYTNLTTTTLYRVRVQSSPCSVAYSATATVTVSPSSTGGAVTSSATVCSGSNSGTLTLAGHSGSVLNWESSTDGGVTWSPIANTTTSQGYTNLTTTTHYRAVVQNGSCTASPSTAAIITVDAVSVGGTLASDATVCASSNSGMITLSGHTGSVQNWESSTDGGTTWNSIANTTTSLNYLNLTDTTLYRTTIKNGVCASTNSSTVTITVDPISVGGSIASGAALCSGLNSGTLTLSGNTGAVQSWEYSTDGGSTWVNIVNTSSSQAYTNISTNTIYRALVKSGVCSSSYSGTVLLTVDQQAVGGTTYGTATVCEGANSGSITLVGYSASIAAWETSTDGGATWMPVAGTSAVLNYTNLLQSTSYHAITSSGVCPNDTSTITVISVDIPSVGGVVSSSDTVCAGANGGTLTLSGNTGNVLNWEYSVDGGTSWVLLSNTTLSQNYSNIMQSAYYRASVKNGVCAADLADSVYIKVDSAVAAGSISSPAQLCISSANGTLALNGYVGSVVDWQSSGDNGATWSGLGNSTSSYAYSGLTDTTWYRTIVSSGVCGNDTSSALIIGVDQLSVGGTIDLSDTVCASSNGATLTINGSTGLVQGWEYSVNGGTIWTPISNTTLSQAYTNLTQTTYYRAIIKNGACPVVYADTAIIKVDPVTVAGTISSPAHLCISNANGTLTLSGYTGSVLDWQSSSDNGATWTGIGNTATTQNYASLTDTTWYRAIVASGVCGNDTAASVIIGVDQLSVGGTIDVSDTVCASLNGDTLNIVGNTGLVQGWEYSIDNGSNWAALTNTSTSFIYSNLTQTTLYRAAIKNGVCPAVYADTAIIRVDPVTVAGAISSPAHLCISNASGTLTLAGYTGSIVDWESSADNGTTWSGLSNTVNTYSYLSLTDTTYYRAIVSSGVCGNDTTANVIIGVDQLSVAGTLSTADTVCAGANADTLALTGYAGTITAWEFSTDNGLSWIPLTNTNDSLSYMNLTASMNYHAFVKNGVCPVAASNDIRIVVDQQSNAGIITGGTAGCELNNHGSLNLTGTVGQVSDWIYSTDNGSTWQSSGVDSIVYVYNNLSDTTMFKAIVQNGVCAKDTAAPTTIVVYAAPVVGFTVDTVCFGDTTHFVNFTTLTSGFISNLTWSYGDGHISHVDQNYMYAAADTFSITLIAYSNFGCLDLLTKTTIVKHAPGAVIANSSPLSFCPGDSTVLSFTLDPNATFTWSTGATTTSVTVSNMDTVLLTVTDTITGCSAKDSVMTVLFPVDSISAGLDTTVSINIPYMLTGYGAGIVYWSPDTLLDNATALSPYATIGENTAFVLQITDANGCVQRDTVNLTVRYDYAFDVKNLITPNGDGQNDKWVIGNIESYPDNQVTVFNREGNVVFQKTGYTNDWEGTFNGKTLPDGAYFYVVKFDNSEKVLKGDLNILSNK
jgi:gliding motility-associated-like protein